MLSRGQVLAVDVDEQDAVDAELEAGQMSLHHGLLFHASHANQSSDRRIGLAIRYITPGMKHLSGVKTYAHLVAGEDREGNFHLVDSPSAVMTPKDVCYVQSNVQMQEQFFYAGAEQS
jgi:ectoine hydroxylase-related dioxygenase (phytanoyl-CoA dioxygenase family)